MPEGYHDKTFRRVMSLLMPATVAGAQEQVQHPIDKALEACIDKNGSRRPASAFKIIAESGRDTHPTPGRP